jgi:hypothetical protein
MLGVPLRAVFVLALAATADNGMNWSVIGVIATVILGVVAIGFAIRGGRRYLTEPRLTVAYHRSFRIGYEGGGPSFDRDEPELVFRGDAIPRVTKVLVFLWNDGRKAVFGTGDHGSPVLANPIQVKCRGGGEILTCQVVKATNRENLVEANVNGVSNAGEIDFRFLNENHGVILAVTHTSDDPFVDVTGVVIGGSDKIRVARRTIQMRRPSAASVGRTNLVAAGTAVAFVIATGRPTERSLVVVAALYGLVGGIGMLLISRRRYPKGLDTKAAADEAQATVEILAAERATTARPQPPLGHKPDPDAGVSER